MAEKFRFFDPVQDENGNYDREYNAQEFVEYFSALVTTGVMKGAGNQLSVTADNASMVTTLDTGIAFILGRYYENDAPLQHIHDTETVGKERIDRIVIRMDNNAGSRYVKSFVKKGIASTAPIAPALTQNDTVYEISVAQVRIVGGQTFIRTENVVDEHGMDIICPWAGSRILPNFNDAALNDLMKSIGEPSGIAELNAAGKVVDAFGNEVEGKVTSVNGEVGDVEISIPEIPDASTSRKGVVQLSNSVTSTSTTQAATANAVKTAYDRGNSAHSLADATNNKVNSNYVAIGGSANASGYGVAVGQSSYAHTEYATALGRGAFANNANQGVLGDSGFTSNWIVPGSFAVNGTKDFEIPHPHPNKQATHVIRHGAVESPTAGDTLYRYEVEATTDGETVELQLPDYFQFLNKNVDVYVSSHLHFGRAYGIVERDVLKVTCEKSGVYKALVIGTRNDDHESVQTWGIKGVEREIGESWTGETYAFSVNEIVEVEEIKEVIA